jgi:hypothetical protein
MARKVLVRVITEGLKNQETKKSKRLGPLNLITGKRRYIYTIAIKLSKIYNN